MPIATVHGSELGNRGGAPGHFMALAIPAVYQPHRVHDPALALDLENYLVLQLTDRRHHRRWCRYAKLRRVVLFQSGPDVVAQLLHFIFLRSV